MARRRRSTAASRANAWGGRAAQAIRRELQPLVDSGVLCPFCRRPILPGQPWDIDHAVPLDVDASGIWDRSRMRPAHASCNRRAGAIHGNRKRARGVVPVRPSQLCAGCAAVWVTAEQWLCPSCALVVAGG